MNIDLLSKLIRELMQDYNEVTLPGLGIFVAEYVSASFSDKGFTVNPPYRRLSFRQKPGIDNRLVDHYADSYGISRKAAERELTDFLAEMKSILRQRKSVTFPEMGRLRATKENHFFFVANEDLSICPESFGLQPVSLKALSDSARVATDRFGSELEVAGGESGVIAPESGEVVVAGGESGVIAPESGEVVAAEVAEPAAESEMLADVASEQQVEVPVAPEFVDEQQVEVGLVAEVAESVEAEPVAEVQSEAVEPVVAESEAPEIVVAEDDNVGASIADEAVEAEDVVSEAPAAEAPAAEESVVEEPVAEEPVAAEAKCSQEEASSFAKADECEAPAEAAAQDAPAEQPEMQTVAQDELAEEPVANVSATVAWAEEESAAEVPAANANVSAAVASDGEKAGNVWWKVLMAVALVVVLFFVALAVLGRVAPGFVDQFLYTPEEIQIINYFK